MPPQTRTTKKHKPIESQDTESDSERNDQNRRKQRRVEGPEPRKSKEASQGNNEGTSGPPQRGTFHRDVAPTPGVSYGDTAPTPCVSHGDIAPTPGGFDRAFAQTPGLQLTPPPLLKTRDNEELTAPSSDPALPTAEEVLMSRESPKWSNFPMKQGEAKLLRAEARTFLAFLNRELDEKLEEDRGTKRPWSGYIIMRDAFNRFYDECYNFKGA